MQRNSATYCDEPADIEAFDAFLEEYDVEARSTQAQDVLSRNPFMSELHSRLVPLVITDETFWQRYFFRCLSFHELSAVLPTNNAFNPWCILIIRLAECCFGCPRVTLLSFIADRCVYFLRPCRL
jgi:hypothetical protein